MRRVAIHDEGHRANLLLNESLEELDDLLRVHLTVVNQETHFAFGTHR